MTDLRQAAQQALEALEYASTGNRRPEIIGPVITALRTALEQQAEPSQWRDMVVVSLVREGIDKHKARELADHFAAQQQAEPVSMRMPKVGDKVICLEDESFGEVVSLTGGGSPDITFDDGTRGTYLLREFAELFGYVAAPQQQAEPPPEWPLIKNILAVFGLDAIAFVAAWKAAQQQAEPGTREGFNNWWDSEYDDSENRFEKDSAAYWAWAGWQAAQRPWVGLTGLEQKALMAMTSRDAVFDTEAKLKERNT